MRTFFYLSDQNVVLEPAREVLPGLWVGRHSGTAFEHLTRQHPSLVLVDQEKLRDLGGAAVEQLLAGQRTASLNRLPHSSEY